MSSGELFEVEFHGGNVTFWAILSVPEVGQEDTEPVKKKLETYKYRDLPLSHIRIGDVKEIVQGEQTSDSISLRVGTLELTPSTPESEDDAA